MILPFHSGCYHRLGWGEFLFIVVSSIYYLFLLKQGSYLLFYNLKLLNFKWHSLVEVIVDDRSAHENTALVGWRTFCATIADDRRLCLPTVVKSLGPFELKVFIAIIIQLAIPKLLLEDPIRGLFDATLARSLLTPLIVVLLHIIVFTVERVLHGC